MTVARSDAFNLLVNIQTQTGSKSNKHLFILTQTLKRESKGQRQKATGIQES